MKESLNFGIIGCGHISKKHADSIRGINNANLVAVSDVNRERGERFATDYKCRYFFDYRDMLRDNIDVVTICTPSGLHTEMTVEAADSGEHVVTEKPMALTLDDADRMIGTCDRNGVRLFVVKQYRYNPPVIEAKRALDGGRFGKLVSLNATLRWCRPSEYYRQDKWRGTRNLDGGIFLNQAVHHLDLLQWFGGPVQSVFATIVNRTHPDIEVEDTGAALIRFTNGALGSIEATTCAYPKNLEGSVTILGEYGSVKIGGVAVNRMETWEFRDYDNDDNIYRSQLTTPDVPNFCHRAFYEEVVDNLIGLSNGIPRRKLENLVDGFEGKKSLELITAIYESARTGKEVYLG